MGVHTHTITGLIALHPPEVTIHPIVIENTEYGEEHIGHTGTNGRPYCLPLWIIMYRILLPYGTDGVPFVVQNGPYFMSKWPICGIQFCF